MSVAGPSRAEVEARPDEPRQTTYWREEKVRLQTKYPRGLVVWVSYAGAFRKGVVESSGTIRIRVRHARRKDGSGERLAFFYPNEIWRTDPEAPKVNP